MTEECLCNTGCNNDPDNCDGQKIDERMHRLHDGIADYLAAKDAIKTGLDDWDRIIARKTRILEILGASGEQWDDYHWQLANRFTTAESLREYLQLNDEETDRIAQVASQYRFAISPYYLSLVDPENPDCPVRDRKSVV